MEKNSKNDYTNQTSCYFCNEWHDNKNIKSHLTHCGNILDKCPTPGCVAYIQRKELETHLKYCPPKAAKQNGNIVDLHVVLEDVAALRKTLNEEIRQRLHLITDVGTLRRRNQVSDEWTQKVGDVLAVLKKCLNEETESRCTDVKKCREDIEKLAQQIDGFDDWRSQLNTRLNRSDSSAGIDDNIRAHVDVLLSDNRITAKKVVRLEADVSRLNDQLKNSNTKPQQSLESKQSLIELSAKIARIDFEVKGMKAIVTETEDKCDKVEKSVAEWKREAAQTRQSLADLEAHLKCQQRMEAIANTRGHLIWRITDYKAKLLDAMENDTTLKSPLFCNRIYGYTLRLDVKLNGVGTWRNRNINACLTAVAGEYDSLLPWPCKLEAEIILKDQPHPYNSDDARDVGKTMVARRVTSEDEDHSQYIYIPHKVVNSRNFINRDAIIFEVRVFKITTATNANATPKVPNSARSSQISSV